MNKIISDGPKFPIATILFAHGAGAPMTSEWMQQVTNIFISNGIKILRFNFPYMQRREEEGRKFPPNRAPILIEHIKNILYEVSNDQLIEGPLFLGGKSMGARISCMIESSLKEGSNIQKIKGNLCFGFPFHPPGKPGTDRIKILNQTKRPTLINQGERDPFGSKAWIKQQKLSELIKLNFIEDGNHDLVPRVRSGITKIENLTKSVEESVRFIKNQV